MGAISVRQREGSASLVQATSSFWLLFRIPSMAEEGSGYY